MSSARAQATGRLTGSTQNNISLGRCGGRRVGRLRRRLERGDSFWDAPTCVESNVLLRYEIDVLDPEALAMDVGERVANTFGSTHRHSSRTEETSRTGSILASSPDSESTALPGMPPRSFRPHVGVPAPARRPSRGPLMDRPAPNDEGIRLDAHYRHLARPQA